MEVVSSPWTNGKNISEAEDDAFQTLTSDFHGDDAPDVLEPDPRPAARNAKAKGTGGSTHKATAAEKRTIKDALDLIQLSIGGGISLRDPHCGGAILEHYENVSAKAMPIIARNPVWVAWFCGSAGWLDIFGLIMALRPVLGTAWGHHVSHSIGGGDDGAGADYSGFEAPDLL